MAVFDANKTINKKEMRYKDKARVTLSFKASAEFINKPSDIVLLFDRSDSMTGERF